MQPHSPSDVGKEGKKKKKKKKKREEQDIKLVKGDLRGIAGRGGLSRATVHNIKQPGLSFGGEKRKRKRGEEGEGGEQKGSLSPMIGQWAAMSFSSVSSSPIRYGSSRQTLTNGGGKKKRKKKEEGRRKRAPTRPSSE